MDWIKKFKLEFNYKKPGNFTGYSQCPESKDHNDTLRKSNRDNISIKELGVYDPLCFCMIEGIKYYFPALIRVSLETMKSDFYFSQLLFHLTYKGHDNYWYNEFTQSQRNLIHDFIESIIMEYPKRLEAHCSVDDAFEALTIWKQKA
jgi:hypothetical protein